MIDKKFILPLFVVLAFVQLLIPIQMITSNEVIINEGKSYKFKTVPIDPNDPLRGKYISLRFEQDSVSVGNEKDWKKEDLAYCYLVNDADGYAIFILATKSKPEAVDYLELPVQSVSDNNENYILIDLPFNRFYMEESKAYEAELIYRKSMNDTTKVTYALVSVERGEAVLEDVMINETSISDLVVSSRTMSKEESK